MAGYQMQVILNGFDKMAAKLNGAPDAIQDVKKKMLDAAALIAEARSRQEAPIDKGILRGSITHETKPEQALVGTNIKYAPYQEYGTGLYSEYPGGSRRPITPKRGRFLAFKIGGKWVFAKQVRGTRPKRFMKKGLEEVKNRIDTVLRIGQEIVDRLSF